MRSNFEPGRVFANHVDFQDRLDAWTDRANGRVHRTIRAVPARRLLEERARMRPLPARMPDLDRRQVLRVAAQPLLSEIAWMFGHGANGAVPNAA